jgi:hypothetical protein
MKNWKDWRLNGKYIATGCMMRERTENLINTHTQPPGARIIASEWLGVG